MLRETPKNFSQYSGLLLLLPFLLISIIPQHAEADRREERVAKAEAQARKLKEKMRREYGGACGTGTEMAGGYPPDKRALFCRYPTRKGHVRHGKYYKWWPDGTVRVEGEFWQGKKHGTWTSYLPNGRKKRQDVYYAGKRQSSVRFDEEGDKVPILNSRQRRLQDKQGNSNRRVGNF